MTNSARRTAAGPDEFLGLAIAAIGLLVLLVLIPLGIDRSEIETDTVLLVRPDFWPNVVAFLMVATGLGFFAIRRFTRRAGRAAEAATSESFSPWGAVSVIAVAALLLAMDDEIGLLIPAIAVFMITSFRFGRDRRVLKVVLAFAVPIALLLFFENVANITMPLGTLVERLIGR